MNYIQKFLGYKKVPNYNVSLRNFLNYLSLEKEDLKKQLNDDYTSDEKNSFIYNCALITINDFFSDEKYYKEPQYSTMSLFNLFEQNFKLRQFDKVEIANEVPLRARKMIDLFKNLLYDGINRVNLMRKSRKLIASVD